MTTAARCDVLLVGGGLANGLIAWRLRQRRPWLNVLLVERQPTLGGQHTWSFHVTDVEPAQNAWLTPLVRRSWPGHEVRFPGLRRRLRGGYRSIASDGFHRELSAALGPSAWLGRSVRELRADGATLDDGAKIEARCVIDGRGFAAGPWLRAGVQKFLGLELVLENEHGLDLPLLMDADVPQAGGFRFFYLLPWDERRLLVEETLYADDGAIDETRARDAIEAYARGRGWRVAAVEGEERGALPIPLAGDVDALWSALPPGVGASGMRAALFHADHRLLAARRRPRRRRARVAAFVRRAGRRRGAAGPVARVVAPPALPEAAEPHAVRGGAPGAPIRRALPLLPAATRG